MSTRESFEKFLEVCAKASRGTNQIWALLCESDQEIELREDRVRVDAFEPFKVS